MNPRMNLWARGHGRKWRTEIAFGPLESTVICHCRFAAWTSQVSGSGTGKETEKFSEDCGYVLGNCNCILSCQGRVEGEGVVGSF